MKPDTLGFDEVRREIGRIEGSSSFRKAPRLIRLLRFLAEQTLWGRPLSASTIAAEFFQAGTENNIRSELGRLRMRLRDYYATEGELDPIRIDIPVGGYTLQVSTFSDRSGNKDRSQNVKIFLSYKNVEPDASLAIEVLHALRSESYSVFIDKDIAVGEVWSDRLYEHIASADVVIVFLSEQAINSSSLSRELELAFTEQRKFGHPIVIPVRVGFEGKLPSALGYYLDHIQHALWYAPSDTKRLIDQLLHSIAALQTSAATGQRPLPTGDVLGPVLKELPLAEVPLTGAIPADSPFYIERAADSVAYAALRQAGTTLVITGSRQVGKTSLLARLMRMARDSGKQVAFIDLQQLSASTSSDHEPLYHAIEDAIRDSSEKAPETTAPISMRALDRQMRRRLLEGPPLVLVFDEIDALSRTERGDRLFSLLRSWHNARAVDPSWETLTFIIAGNVLPRVQGPSSPFNVGQVLELEDFNLEQIGTLNRRYGDPISPRGVRKLLQLLGGQPYLVQLALHVVATGRISEADLFSHASDDRGPFGDHLRAVSLRLRGNSEWMAGFREVILYNRCSERQYEQLREAGLVRRVGREVFPRALIYKTYVGDFIAERGEGAQGPAIQAVASVFDQAGAIYNPEDPPFGVLTFQKGRLKAFGQVPVLISTGTTSERDVIALARMAMLYANNRHENVAVLFYSEAPDALVRMQIAAARFRDRCSILPIPLSAAEQAVVTVEASVSLFEEYAERYLRTADFFDDTKAIGDTLAFFGRSELLHRLVESDLQRCQGIGIFGLRKSGKTSLLLQVGLALRDNPVIHCDLQKYGGMERFGATLFNEILQKLSAQVLSRIPKLPELFPPFELGAPAASVSVEFSRRFGLLAGVLPQAGFQLPVVCMLDEVERILPFPCDSHVKAQEFNAFFGTLRSISQAEQRLAILVADVHPDCTRINSWPQHGLPSNPVYAFFKELFLQPFSEDDTKTMIRDIGQLMGRSFDELTLRNFHNESGGHPFLSRQLASLVCRKLPTTSGQTITWDAARSYVQQPFFHSGLLKDYFAQNIWNDLEKRAMQAAMDVIRILSCSAAPGHEVAASAVHVKLGVLHSEGEVIDALLWLEAVGILAREPSTYCLRVPLVARWLRMTLNAADQAAWRVAEI